MQSTMNHAAASIDAFLSQVGDVISLDDVRHHDWLRKLVLAADGMSSRVDPRALEWCKAQPAAPAQAPAPATSAAMGRARELIAIECEAKGMDMRAHLYRTGGNDEQPELSALAKLLDVVTPRPLGEILREGE